MSSKRLFVAIGVPESIRGHLARMQEHPAREIRWMAKVNFHLTLRFIGEVGEEGQRRLIGRLREIAVAPFTLRLGGLGVFPPRGEPRVIWAGLGSGHPLLFQLRQQVDDAILAAGLECEMRDFVPHITLGRCVGVSRESIRGLKAFADDGAGPVFAVTRFTLFESLRTPSGSRYVPVRIFPMKLEGPSRKRRA